MDSHVGARIRLRRKYLGMSQSELADSIQLTFQQVQKYERGANRVSASMLFKIAKSVNAPVAYFFDGLGGSTETEGPSSSEEAVNRFLHTTEGLEIAQLFPLIQKPALKRRILELIRALSETDDQDPD